MNQLNLEAYRHLVALDEPFVTPNVERPDTDALLRVALDFLETEPCQSAENRTLSHLGDARRRLRALLTLRPPTPLPAAAQEAIDALLQLERTSRCLADAWSFRASRSPRRGPARRSRSGRATSPRWAWTPS